MESTLSLVQGGRSLNAIQFSQLKSSQRLILNYLASKFNFQTQFKDDGIQGSIKLSHHTIAERCGLSVATVRRHLKALATEGYIVVIGRLSKLGDRLCNAYQITAKLFEEYRVFLKEKRAVVAQKKVIAPVKPATEQPDQIESTPDQPESTPDQNERTVLFPPSSIPDQPKSNSAPALRARMTWKGLVGLAKSMHGEFDSIQTVEGLMKKLILDGFEFDDILGAIEILRDEIGSSTRCVPKGPRGLGVWIDRCERARANRGESV